MRLVGTSAEGSDGVEEVGRRRIGAVESSAEGQIGNALVTARATDVSRLNAQPVALICTGVGPWGTLVDIPPAFLSPGIRVTDVALLQRRKFLLEIFKRRHGQVGAVQVQFAQTLETCQSITKCKWSSLGVPLQRPSFQSAVIVLKKKTNSGRSKTTRPLKTTREPHEETYRRDVNDLYPHHFILWYKYLQPDKPRTAATFGWKYDVRCA